MKVEFPSEGRQRVRLVLGPPGFRRLVDTLNTSADTGQFGSEIFNSLGHFDGAISREIEL